LENFLEIKNMNIVPKGWGHEKIIHNSNGYCGKVLCFDKGKKCSYHYHKIKDEHSPTITPVPELPSLFLLLIGLIGFFINALG